MLPKINTLPGAKSQLPRVYGDIQADLHQDRLHVARRVIRPLKNVTMPGLIIGDKTIHK